MDPTLDQLLGAIFGQRQELRRLQTASAETDERHALELAERDQRIAALEAERDALLDALRGDRTPAFPALEHQPAASGHY